MNPIYENSWRVHLATGIVLEEDLYGDYRLIGVEITQQGSVVEYKYRLLFFPLKEKVPILAINLEKNAFAEQLGGGAYFLGIHDSSTHHNMGYALDGRADINYDDFRDVAWPLAAQRLKLE